MPATTPKYNFPYPLLTEAPNGPAAIQALAEAVERKFDVGTTPEIDLRRTAAQSIAADSEQSVVWQSASVNIGNMWPGNSSIVTISADGIYAIDGTVQFTGKTIFSAAIYINGSPRARNVTAIDDTKDTVNKRTQAIAISRTIRLVVGDTITLRVYNADTAAHDVQPLADTGTRLSVYWLRP